MPDLSRDPTVCPEMGDAFRRGKYIRRVEFVGEDYLTLWVFDLNWNFLMTVKPLWWQFYKWVASAEVIHVAD